MKKRLDLILFEKFSLSSKEYAKKLILLDKVIVNSNKCTKPGMKFGDDIKIEIVGDIEKKFVSRGGFKLEMIIDELSLDITDKICLDIGASTGGFTDCLLQKGGKKVYCIDVGYGQLDNKLRNDKRVINFERENFRHFDIEKINDKLDILVCDVSFISFNKIIDKFNVLLDENNFLLYLIKPQFEAGKDNLKKGIVVDRKIHKMVINKIYNEAKQLGLNFEYLTYSPITGPKGNIEYLVKISKKDSDFKIENIEKVVELSWQKLKK